MHPTSESARPRSRWRALWVLLSGICGAALLVEAGHVWLSHEVQAQARARGVELTGCRFQLGFSALRLLDCEFDLLHEAQGSDGAKNVPWVLGATRVSGRVARLELEFGGFQLARVLVEGADVNVRGEPPWLEWLEMASNSTSVRDALPVDVRAGRLSWATHAEALPLLTLSEIRYEASAQRLRAEFATSGGWHGHASSDSAGLSLTLGDPERPKARLAIRSGVAGERAELGVELENLPLTDLESSWLSVPAPLRGVSLVGRLSATIPFGLSSELPGGAVDLTLSGLQFPVPTELDGLVHDSAPKVWGKFNLSRSLDRATFRDLTWLTGELEMHGQARLERAGEGIAVRANLGGPLSCAAIAASAARAQSGKVLAPWARRLAQHGSGGSIQIVAVLQGNSAELERAHVLTSVGVGCGLEPLPIAADVPRELIERLPAVIRRSLPRIDNQPGLRLPVPDPILPDHLQMPRLPGPNLPAPSHAREPTARG